MSSCLRLSRFGPMLCDPPVAARKVRNSWELTSCSGGWDGLGGGIGCKGLVGRGKETQRGVIAAAAAAARCTLVRERARVIDASLGRSVSG